MSTWPGHVALIGCGAMGTAMLRGIRRASPGEDAAVTLVDPIAAAAEAAAAATGGTVGTVTEAGAADLVVLAVKPKDAPALLRGLSSSLSPRTIVVSVVAGLAIADLARLAGITRVVRTMPNLAVAAGSGLVAVADDALDEDERVALEAVLAPAGTVLRLPESQFAAATALAGSGPGFVALVAEGLEEGAVSVGFTRAEARRMVHAVLAGTADLLADGTDPAALRQRVSSPAGTTVEGVAVLERGAVRAHLVDAVRAASGRAASLAAPPPGDGSREPA